MKKAWLYAVCIVFVLPVFAFSADRPASPVNDSSVKANLVKAAKMHATGKVIEISDVSMKIERTVKGDVETMVFDLDKPEKGILVNDYVKIDYMEKEGKLVASRVAKVHLKKK